MREHGMYFGKEEFYQIIKDIGGQWNDSKERPIVCLIKSVECESIYWAIPVGNWNHRDEKAKMRINRYLAYKEADIRSCFYHVGNTDVKSIFFISDVVPITIDYIEREYIGKYSNEIYVIKNKTLLAELTRKLKRILAVENAKPNYYRQHITDIKNYLIEEMNSKMSVEAEVPIQMENTIDDRKHKTKILSVPFIKNYFSNHLSIKKQANTPMCFKSDTYVNKLVKMKLNK